MPRLITSPDGEELPGYYIHMISHRLKWMLGEQLKPYGITGQQARVVALIGAGEKRGESLSQKELEKELCLRGPSVTSLLNGLEKRGFITRVYTKQDGRKKRLSLTEKGEMMHRLFCEALIENETHMMQGLDLSKRREFLQMLKDLSDAVERKDETITNGENCANQGK